MRVSELKEKLLKKEITTQQYLKKIRNKIDFGGD